METRRPYFRVNPLKVSSAFLNKYDILFKKILDVKC